jgi:hypothetical protein
MEEDKRNFFVEILSSGIVGFRSFSFVSGGISSEKRGESI